MSIPVEHEKRKHEILAKAFEVFLEEGYANATFQKIADRCEITRTTLYIYFKNKREIFLFSIKQVTDTLEQQLERIVYDEAISAKECLEKTLDMMMNSIEENKQLFNVLLPYLIDLQKSGVNTKDRIMRRILRLRHYLSTVIIRGQKNGEFKKESVKDLNDLFYDLIQAAIFRLVIISENDVGEVRNTIKLVISKICA